MLHSSGSDRKCLNKTLDGCTKNPNESKQMADSCIPITQQSVIDKCNIFNKGLWLINATYIGIKTSSSNKPSVTYFNPLLGLHGTFKGTRLREKYTEITIKNTNK